MLSRDFGAATDHALQLLAMGNQQFQSRTALLIVDVQIGLVGLVPVAVRDSSLQRLQTRLQPTSKSATAPDSCAGLETVAEMAVIQM
jgi:hypothetical protein